MDVNHLKQLYKKHQLKRRMHQHEQLHQKMQDLSKILKDPQTQKRIVEAAKQGEWDVKVMDIERGQYPEFHDHSHPDYDKYHGLLVRTCKDAVGLYCNIHDEGYVYVYGWL